jgi:hypothetical protein
MGRGIWTLIAIRGLQHEKRFIPSFGGRRRFGKASPLTSLAVSPITVVVTNDSGIPTRWFGVGSSSEADAREAGVRAADGAIMGEHAKLLIAFCSDRYDIETLTAGINQRSGGVPLIGCSTAGEIATAGPGDASVVVVALGGDGFSVATGFAADASRDLRAAGERAAACMADLERGEHRALILLTDGLAGDQQEIVRGAHSMLGAGVPLVGGCAGDDLKMSRTFQFVGGRVLTDSVVAAALGSDAPIGIGVRHGWRRVGDPVLVTRSAGNQVYELDDQPALDVYLERLAVPEAARQDPAAFTRFALTHPLGVGRRSGEDQVRFVGGANFEERSLSCIAEIPPAAMAWFMEGDAASVMTATDSACRDALEPLGGGPPLGMIAFDCIARRGVLGEEGIREEICRLGTVSGGAQVAGFYTYGEIARTRGAGGFHNQTLVVLAFS